MIEQKKANTRLSIITFITCLGDFISSFAILSIFFTKTNSALKSADISRIETFAIILSGLILAKLISKYGAKSLIVKSQAFSFLISLLIIIFFKSDVGIWLFSISYFLLKISEEVFKSSRELESKSFGCHTEQRSLQAEIMVGFFSAQFLGPLLSVWLLKEFPIEVALTIDALTFLICTILAKKLPEIPIETVSTNNHSSYLKSLFKPLTYLNEFPSLNRIFLLRAFGHAIPVGLFNFTIFVVVSSKFQRDIVETAFIYSATGAGGLISGTVLRHKQFFSNHKIPDNIVSFYALLLMGIFEYAFIKVDQFSIAITLTFLTGMCMAANGISSQSLRRKLSTKSQFPEIVGLEIFISKIIEFSSASIVAILIQHGLISNSDGIILAAGLLIIVAFLYLFGEFNNEQTESAPNQL